MKLKKPTIVLFDMDGTTVRHINPRMLHALEKLDDISFTIGGFVKNLRRKKNLIEAIRGTETHFDEKRPRLIVHRAIHKFRRKSVEQIVEPCPGIQQLLDHLKRAGIPMAIVSNGLGKGYGHDILTTFDLEKYFDATIFREDISQSKPHPEPLLKALTALNMNLTEQDVVWYIGDRRKDVLAAIAADQSLPCTVQPLSYGLNAAIAILERNTGTDHIITTYHDFLEVVDDLLPLGHSDIPTQY